MSPLQRDQFMEYQEDEVLVDIIQSVSGNWSVYSAGQKIDDAVFRRCSDAQEWCNAEGYIIDRIEAWTANK